MYDHNRVVISELNRWKREMRMKPSIFNRASKGVQNKFNGILPEKYHDIMTAAIKNMTKGVLLGSEYIAKKPIEGKSLELRDELAKEKINFYKNTAIIEGAGTGAGGFLLGLADFPLLLSIKIKFLYEMAAIYGFDVKDYRERLYILYIFQLAFSSQAKTNEIFEVMDQWEKNVATLPRNINEFDWREFQQEYRDYIDLAKLLQLVPFIGAFVGAYANSKLLDKLGKTAMNAYRMRILEIKKVEY
ncbi:MULTISPECIES: EcsC family protein [Clostridium]|uniref:EcsC family protein n=1 Tax=Clostridium paridis TaxID=2803863 RepID=A0A937K4E9_9CLOT|nr:MULTISPECIES: EcsC family protein [Clostridium]MBL4931799.1 EcsC family protein [Clostridium paridis]